MIKNSQFDKKTQPKEMLNKNSKFLKKMLETLEGTRR